MHEIKFKKSEKMREEKRFEEEGDLSNSALTMNSPVVLQSMPERGEKYEFFVHVRHGFAAGQDH